MSFPNIPMADTIGLKAPALPKIAATGKPAPVAPVIGRDQRLDMFRGIALLMIFINHVPGTMFEGITSRNFGFSDAAEAFVFMSGMAAGLAYSMRFATGSFWLATLKVWARARHLYFTHITTTMIALGIFAGAATIFGLTDLLTTINMSAVWKNTLGALVGIPLLTHQLGYFNILPLYMTFLLVTPALLWIGLRYPMHLLLGSALLWALAGQFRLNFPNYPNPGGWFFNPIAWQFIFVVGLLAGTAMKRGEQFIGYHRQLFLAACGFLVLVLLWMKLPPLGQAMNSAMYALSQAGAPFYITAHDKTFLSLPRLLHVLALIYVMASLGVVRQLAESRYARPFTLLGRHGLPVFATGSVLSILLQAIKAGIDNDPVTDALLLAAGIGAQLGLALMLEKVGKMQKQAAQAAKAKAQEKMAEA